MSTNLVFQMIAARSAWHDSSLRERLDYRGGGRRAKSGLNTVWLTDDYRIGDDGVGTILHVQFGALISRHEARAINPMTTSTISAAPICASRASATVRAGAAWGRTQVEVVILALNFDPGFVYDPLMSWPFAIPA